MEQQDTAFQITLQRLPSIAEENESPSSDNVSSPKKDLVKSGSILSRDPFLAHNTSSKGKFHLVEEQPSFLILQGESSAPDDFCDQQSLQKHFH